MNYVIKQVREYGGEITQANRYVHTAESRCISFFGEQIEFFIEEKVDRFDYQPTKKEIAESKKYSWRSYPNWAFKPSGKLSLRIDFSLWDSSGLRKSWSDKNNIKLEDQIPNFMIAAVTAANALRDKREIEQEKERLREIERQRLLEIERQQQLEREKLEELELDAKNWEKANRLRRYIKAIERKKRNEHPDELPDKDIKWLEWALKHANRIDPIK